MRPFLAALAVALAATSPAATATDYHVLTSILSGYQNHSTCSVGACTDYVPGLRMTGAFTTAAPIVSPGADLATSVVSFSFTDGINTWSSADPNVRISQFQVAVDAGGRPTTMVMILHRWQTAGPHAAGARLDVLSLGPGIAGVAANLGCSAVGVHPTTAIPDFCTATASDTNTSQAGASFYQRFAVGAPVPVPPLQPTTYTFGGPAYGSFVNHTACAVGTCGDFDATMRVTGTMTTFEPLPPGLAAQLMNGIVAAYAFSDGLTTYDSTDPQVREGFVFFGTDGFGVPSDTLFVLMRWQQGAGPHAPGDRADVLQISGPTVQGGKNINCPTVDVFVITGEADFCGIAPDSGTSIATGTGIGGWSGPPRSVVPVPGPAGRALVLLATLVALAGAIASRRRAPVAARAR